MDTKDNITQNIYPGKLFDNLGVDSKTMGTGQDEETVLSPSPMLNSPSPEPKEHMSRSELKPKN